MANTNLSSHDDHHDAHVADIHTFGFWLYLMTDVLLFGTLFAVFIVLGLNVVPYKFDMNLVLAETIILLTSSFTFGLATIYASRADKAKTLLWMAITFFLGVSFLCIELYEFYHLIHEGKSWTHSAYYSSFFGLVGTHGLHVFVGLCWIIVLSIQIMMKGLNGVTIRKLTLLSLFWHFLDIVWIFVFSVVYLTGAV